MTILPAVPFPNILWLRHYRAAEHVVIDLGEHYPKQTWRNRFDLLGSHGAFACTARVVGQKGEKISTGAIQLVNDEWRRVALRGLTAGYARAPYFIDYHAEVEHIISKGQTYLHEFSLEALEFTLKALQWEVKHTLSESYVETPENGLDLREAFKPSQAKIEQSAYPQVFEDRFGFVGGLSVLDLLLNTGPEASLYFD